MKVLKKISIVYILQVLVVILLFYPGAAEETALTDDTSIKKKNEYTEKKSNQLPKAAGPALFFTQPESEVKDFYFLSSFVR